MPITNPNKNQVNPQKINIVLFMGLLLSSLVSEMEGGVPQFPPSMPVLISGRSMWS
jgi:hypothetical protein